MAQGIHSKKIAIRSNGLGYPFEKDCHPFERLGISVFKKLLTVRTAQAIRSKKNLSIIRATEAICSKINFRRVSIPKPFHHWPLVSNDLLFSRSRTLRSLFTNVSYTNLCSIVAIFAFILSIDYRQYQHTFYSILKFFFGTSFPKIFNFYLLCFCSLWASGTKLHFPCMSRTQNTKNRFF